MAAKLVLKMHQSLDGYVASLTGDDSWLFAHMDDAVFAWETERLTQAGVHIMGRTLYEIMAAYWPTASEGPARPMNAIPKVVFSKSLKSADWGPVRIADGDLATEIARLKSEHARDVLAHGGASFAKSLMRLNLVDEVRLLIHPATLGGGKAWVASGHDLRLVSSHVFANGVVALTYATNATHAEHR